VSRWPGAVLRFSAVRTQHGFTMAELVIVIVILGVLSAIVGSFIVRPVQGYLSTVARVELVDATDNALRRIGRDLRIALPNSVRVAATGLTLELIPTTAGGRYFQDDAAPSAQRLSFGGLDTDGFDVMGPGVSLHSSQDLVFYNLGEGAIESDAYAASNTVTSNRRPYTGVTSAAVTSIATSTWAALPVAARATPFRFQAVDPPVSYHCDLGAGTLTRFINYGFNASQISPPTGGSSAILAAGVTDCRFSYDANAVAARAGLVSMALTLSATTPGSGAETVSLYHSVHVDNLP
jgi:MSHA biogenesis protein MshO